MDNTIQLVAHGTDLYLQCVALRNEILRKPLGLSFSAEQLQDEAADWHIAYSVNGVLVACLSLQQSKLAIKMRQVAVQTQWQQRGIGKDLCLYAEKIARAQNASYLYCHARLEAVPFYLKLGYEVLGDAFEEVGIVHYYMKKELND